jgi:hypothetical protein
MTPTTTTARAALDLSGYVYECSCGELYSAIDHAVSCRKCRNYSMGSRCLYVTDTRTDAIVWGRLPTPAEVEQYVAEMEREAEADRLYVEQCEALAAQELAHMTSRHRDLEAEALEALEQIQEDLELGNCRRW